MIMAFDGMTAYYYMDYSWFLLFVEVLTVIVEAIIFLGYWWFKDGKLRWYEIVAISVIVNVVTAAMGLGIGQLYPNIDGQVNLGSFMFGFLIIAVIIAGTLLIAVGLHTKEDSPVTTEKVTENDHSI